MQDNQIFAACAFLVGRNYFSPAPDAVFLGKSAIFAPQELTPRFNGVLVEMGNFGSEGVLTGEWDSVALKELWAKSETSVRNQMNASQASQMLAALYRQLQSLPRLEDQGEVEPAGNVSNGSPQNRPERMSLDDLPVIASVTSRWPPRAADEGDIPLHEAVNWTIDSPAADSTGSTPDPRHEEETDEMDALDDESRSRRDDAAPLPDAGSLRRPRSKDARPHQHRFVPLH